MDDVQSHCMHVESWIIHLISHLNSELSAVRCSMRRLLCRVLCIHQFEN